jgi:hypothetical protein
MNERTIFLCDLTKCKLNLEKPITLPCCGHTICQKHVQLIGEDKKYKCDLCGKLIQTPVGGFHINLKLSYLIELNRSQKKQTTFTNKQRSFSVGRPITNSNLSLFNNKNNEISTASSKNSIINLSQHHQATKRKSSLSSLLPLSAQSTPPQSPSSPTPSGLLPKNIKSRIPLPIPPKRKQILSESGVLTNIKCDLNDSGLISTPALRQQKENINRSSDQLIMPSSRRLLQSSPILSLSKIPAAQFKSSIRKDEPVILDAQIYRSLIQDLHDTKDILYRLEEMLLNDVNCSSNESGLNDSVINELNKSDFVFEI